MKYPLCAFTNAIEMLLRDPTKRTVTVFIPPKTTCRDRVRVTWVHKPRAKAKEQTFVVTFGRPNYAEREWLALCKKAKCNPRRIWFKFWPKKKRAK